RNLYYALAAVMGDKNCSVRDPQVRVGEPPEHRNKHWGKQFGCRVHFAARIENEGGGELYFNYGSNSKIQSENFTWARTTPNSRAMGVTEWLFGATGNGRTQPNLYEAFSKKGACSYAEGQWPKADENAVPGKRVPKGSSEDPGVSADGSN
ncbi:MAG TPA: hypothetical protein VFV50_07760, partial [Bdellovibrionales bacterium]|nr:hypothetical protein [Bdellovibrionales bacterium]